MDEQQLKACLSYLCEVGVIGFLDTYDVCNIYILQDYESIWKAEVINDLIKYSRRRQAKLCDVQRFGEPSSFNDSYVEVVKDDVKVEDVQAVFSLFHSNVNIYRILINPIFIKISSVIDFHRFIVYCCIKKILRRVYIYPIYQPNPSSYHHFLHKTFIKEKRAGEADHEAVGMNMDILGEESEEMSSMRGAKSALISLRKTYYSMFRYSNYHSMYDKEKGMSRHSSFISFNQDHLVTSDCSCKPDKAAILKYISSGYRCLEAISLHTECCIPSILNLLQEMDDVLFLKVLHVCFK